MQLRGGAEGVRRLSACAGAGRWPLLALAVLPRQLALRRSARPHSSSIRRPTAPTPARARTPARCATRSPLPTHRRRRHDRLRHRRRQASQTITLTQRASGHHRPGHDRRDELSPSLSRSPFGIAIDGGGVTDLVHGQVTSDGVRGLCWPPARRLDDPRAGARQLRILAEPDPAIEVDSTATRSPATRSASRPTVRRRPEPGGHRHHGARRRTRTRSAAIPQPTETWSSTAARTRASLNADGIFGQGDGSTSRRDEQPFSATTSASSATARPSPRTRTRESRSSRRRHVIGGPPRPTATCWRGTDSDRCRRLHRRSSAGHERRGTTVQNNLIGLSADGAESLPRPVSGDGIDVEDLGSNTIADNAIAGHVPGHRHLQLARQHGHAQRGRLEHRQPGRARLRVADQGISMENDACAQSVGARATGNTIGGSPGNGNTVIGSQLHDIAVDADQNTVSFNTVARDKRRSGHPGRGSNNMIEFNTITGADDGRAGHGHGVQVDSGPEHDLAELDSRQPSLGIDLGGDGITPNDPRPDATRPEQSPELPDPRSVTDDLRHGGTTSRSTGTLDSAPGTVLRRRALPEPERRAGPARRDLPRDDPGRRRQRRRAFDDDVPGRLVGRSSRRPPLLPTEAPPSSRRARSSKGTRRPPSSSTRAPTQRRRHCSDVVCSLRDAINAGQRRRAARSPSTSRRWPQTIDLSRPQLPAITAPVTIDGTTQPGTPANTPGVTIVTAPRLHEPGSTSHPGPAAPPSAGSRSATSGDASARSGDHSSSRTGTRSTATTSASRPDSGSRAPARSLRHRQQQHDRRRRSAGDRNVIAASSPEWGSRPSRRRQLHPGQPDRPQPGWVDRWGSAPSAGSARRRDEHGDRKRRGTEPARRRPGAPRARERDRQLGATARRSRSRTTRRSRSAPATRSWPGTSSASIAAARRRPRRRPGIDIEDSGPNQIGPGNVIAHSFKTAYSSSTTVTALPETATGSSPTRSSTAATAASALVNSGNADQPAPVHRQRRGRHRLGHGRPQQRRQPGLRRALRQPVVHGPVRERSGSDVRRLRGPPPRGLSGSRSRGSRRARA